ncbi:SUMF1/EgtB/PvdO family nonheme iron enzyme [Dysgonomonas sp. 520]|uniref:formylglycine-generating enzyme family protein n=1 Tax=Dysgonomonas sp. 520 TaxID=2302931 RepID=UPI0013D78922|nr:SUMF1/EgtB/PvdO family nonheme iron enzyme [Dysgonomonas sp. 520]
MNKTIIKLVAFTMLFLAVSCDSDDNDGKYKGAVEPGDSHFSSEPVSDGTPLVAANIDVTKLGVVTGDPEDPAELAALRAERKKIIEKAISDMVFVDGGSFLMGATAEQGSGVHLYEQNVHKVTLSDYYISKFQVTQELYLIVMGGTNQGSFKEDGNLNIPIDNRLFSEMETFVAKLNEITGLEFALPTEAQWEFAARGGRKRTGLKYAGSNDIEEVGYYWDNSSRTMMVEGESQTKRCPEKVGTKKPNELGLYDMSGNMAEACQDWYAPYETTDQVDPTGPESLPEDALQKKVCRGGGWITFADPCRISARSAFVTTGRFNYLGFRLVHPKTN